MDILRSKYLVIGVVDKQCIIAVRKLIRLCTVVPVNNRIIFCKIQIIRLVDQMIDIIGC